MGLLAFVVVALLGAAITGLLGGAPRARAAAGVVALAACVALAYLLDPAAGLRFGDEILATTHFLRLWLLTASAAALLLELVGLAASDRRGFAAGALLMLAASAVALALPEFEAALLLLAGGAAVLGVAVAGRMSEGSPTLRAGVDALRVTVAVAVLGLLGIAWAAEPGVALQPTTIVAAYLLVAAALVLRTGAVPLHLPAARLAEVAPRPLVPLLSGWLPAATALVLVGWFAAVIQPLTPDLGWWRALPVMLALLTLGATSLAMLLQDDLGHLLGYAAIQGGAFALLALGSLEAATWPQVRGWLLILPLTLAALSAVVMTLAAAFRTRRVAELHGWLRRAPLTGAALLLALVATYGLPGLFQFEARREVATAAAGPALGALGLLAAAVALLAWLRLGWLGLRRPGQAVREGTGERPALPEGAAIAGPARAQLRALAGRAVLGLELNRVALAAAVTLLLAILPVAIGMGAGHLAGVAAEPLPTPNVTASPTPGPSLEPSPSAEPSSTPAEPTAAPESSEPSFPPTDAPATPSTAPSGASPSSGPSATLSSATPASATPGD
ncbi:MAG: proton-conducting transporter transmembrane domain-containing protein [Candidatus Limnocylindrales bacterium]